MAARDSGLGGLRRLVGWPLVVLLATVAFILGYIGFAAAPATDDESAIDLAYLSLQLFTVNSGTAAGPSPPLALEIARWLAPVATAYALGRALLRVFRDEIDQWLLHRRNGHVVVIGLGWLGLAVVDSLVDRGKQVVAVAIDVDEETAAAMRRDRVPVVVGDARDPEVLEDARVHRAEHVVVLAGTDEMNVEMALAVQRLSREQGEGSLVCLTHVRDAQLCHLLRSKALADEQVDGFRLELFNVAEEAAAIMLDEHAPFLVDDALVRIGVIGDNDIAAAVITEASRIRGLGFGETLDVVWAAPGDSMERTGRRLPQVQRNAAVEVVPGPPGTLEAKSIEHLAGCRVVFVGLDDDSSAIATALYVADRIAPVPVVVALGAWTGLSELLSTASTGFSKIYPFLVYERLLGADLLLAGMGEKLARLVHTMFVEERTAGSESPDPATLVEWRDLPEEYRASSRAQAARLGPKLYAIGCGLAPLEEWGAPEATLTEDEVEKLAQLEHEGFVAERMGAGWEKGAMKDRDRRIDPFLVSWDELARVPGGEEARNVNRAAAWGIPALLARAGYRLVRPAHVPEDLRP